MKQAFLLGVYKNPEYVRQLILSLSSDKTNIYVHINKDNYETSMKIGQDLFDAINADNYHKVICDCGTCRMQIQHGTDVKAVHPIEILAKAYKKA